MKTKLPTEWQELSDQLGFQEFTPIQTQLFEPLLAGENLLGVSPTGTGKTLAYLLPSLLRLQKKKAQQLLILAPNTELAGQIFDVCKTWTEAIGLTAQLFLSGSSQKRQIERLKKGPEILIGTPGRIFELIKLKKIKMMNVETIILDEFDQLLDDSQIHFVEKITHYKYYRALFSGIELKLKYCLQKKLHTLDVHRANGDSFDIEFLVFQDNFM